jgi:uncharacterized protein YhaN
MGVAHHPDADTETISSLAQATLKREAECKILRKTLHDRARAMKTREQALKHALEVEQAWQSSWSNACAKTWMRDLSAREQVSTVREILAVIPNLGAALDRRANLLDRIDKMAQDQHAFAAAVAGAALSLGIADDASVPLDLDRKLTARVQAARTARDLKAAKSRDLEDARKQHRAIQDRLAIHRARKAEMTGFFGAVSLAEVGARLHDIERRSDLRKQVEDAARDIIDAVRTPDLDEAETVLDQADRATLEAELIDLSARFDDFDRRARELFAEHSKAEDQIAAMPRWHGSRSSAERVCWKSRTARADICACGPVSRLPNTPCGPIAGNIVAP